MFERVIFNAIKNGIEGYSANPVLITELFNLVNCLSLSESEKIREFWEARPPEVHHGYAQTESKFPAYFVTLTGENQAQQYLGNAVGEFGSRHGSIYSTTVTVLVYADHPDVCLYMYQILKAIFVLQERYIRETALTLELSGSDLAPDNGYVPNGLFARRFTVAAQTEYNIEVPANELLAFKIAGVHADPDGPPTVKSLVTVDGS